MATATQVIDALSPILSDERRAQLDRVAESRLASVAVVLEDLYDAHNGAAVLRSSEAVGVLEVRTVPKRLSFSDKVTQGCEKWLELSHDPSIEACVAGLKKRGFLVCAAVPRVERKLLELPADRPVALLFGNEHAGLTARARELADVEFAIPLDGFSESLNLSVAAAVCLFTHAERRRIQLGKRGDLTPEALLELRARYYHLSVRGADEIIARHLRDNSNS